MTSITDLLTNKNEDFDSQSIPGFVQGKVVENNNSNFKGMVKVEFTVWESKKNVCEWVRLLSPYTGKDSGTYMVPEIDSIVLVGFIGGSLKRPFLMGCLYPSDSQIVSSDFDENNAIKSLKTKGGISIRLNDEKDKQSVEVMTPQENKLILDDGNKNFILTDKAGKNKMSVDFEKGELAILADKKIMITCGSSKVTLEQNGAITLEGANIKVNASNEVALKGTSKANLNGGMVEVSATQTLSAKGNMQTEIKGGLVKIN